MKEDKIEKQKRKKKESSDVCVYGFLILMYELITTEEGYVVKWQSIDDSGGSGVGGGAFINARFPLK